MDRMISIRSRTRLAVSRQNFNTVTDGHEIIYAIEVWHARINRNGRTSVKKHIQLTKGFIEREQIQSWLDPSSIFTMESQLGENSLARGIHAIMHNHGKSRPQTHIRQQRMDYIAYYEYISGWGRDYVMARGTT